jgi:hypothetical protein
VWLGGSKRDSKAFGRLLCNQPQARMLCFVSYSYNHKKQYKLQGFIFSSWQCSDQNDRYQSTKWKKATTICILGIVTNGFVPLFQKKKIHNFFFFFASFGTIFFKSINKLELFFE